MTRQSTWFQPRPLEGALFDYALYVGGAETHSGDNATRRDEAAHGAFVAARPPGGPWLMPLMEVGCVDIRKTSPRKTDLFRITASLLLSDRAHDVLAPLAGEGVEFLPVEVTDGSRLWWTRAPVIPEAMDLERSKLSVFEGEIRSINRPVLRGSAIPEGLGFLALDPRRASPMLSGAVADAIRAHDLYGIGLREILVI